ncbi:MAG: PLP-dependent transferase [Proteobacteria bacterium]|nr:PLP-dependent transferase [Pseudomonadota bacterium]
MGCVESLVAPSMLLFGSDLTTADADRAGIRSNSVRLAIGIESLQDLIYDLNQAFIAIGGI